MAFTEKKYLELSALNKKKKLAFAILEFLENKQPEYYIQQMLSWYKQCYDDILTEPKQKRDWQIIHQILLQQIEQLGQNIDVRLFDGNPTYDGQGVIILDNIRAPYNVGGIMRSAEAFNLSEVVMCGITPTIQNGKVLRSAMNVPIKTQYFSQTAEAINFYRNQGYQIISIEKTKNSIDICQTEMLFPIDKRALIVGNEEFGVDENVLNLSDIVMHINLTGSKNSLNVCTATGIALYCLFCKK